MKKFISILTVLLLSSNIFAAGDASSIRIYLNAGHGSWGPNDRPMATIPYPMLSSTGRPDTCGFYESNTNLWKILRLGQKLVANGFSKNNIVYSRVATGPYPYVAGASNEDEYNRNLSEICEEVEAGNFDMFLSVHSNAASDGSIANYPLFLYRGYDDGSGAAEGSVNMCSTIWPYLMSNGIDYYTAYKTSKNIRGDISFYHSSSTATRSDGKSYTGYLGVLKHGVPGFLSEGYFHTYQPARHRALNKDYCGQEGIRYLRGILDYFGLPAEKVGYIMGTVKDSKNTITHPLYTYASGTDDQWYPINGATVSLLKDNNIVDIYQVDNNYNGVFVFSDLEPGNYTLECTAPNYNALASTYKGPFTVTANQTTYSKIYLTPKTGYTPPYPAPITSIFEEGAQTHYAYNLSYTSTDTTKTFKFWSTGDAVSGEIILTDQTSKKTTTLPLNTISKGANSLTIKNSDLASGTYDWAVHIKSTELSTPTIFFNLSETSTGSGVAVNTNSTSKYFGQIYFADGYTMKGIYVLDPDMETNNYTALFNGKFVGSESSPGRLAINPNNDYVYAADAVKTHSGIYYFSPASTSRLTYFFTGSRDSTGLISLNSVAQGSRTTGLTFSGIGDNTKLFAYEADYPTIGNYTLCKYDVGTNLGWGEAPSTIYTAASDLLQNHNINLIGDENGVWISQTRNAGYNTTAIPALIYMNNDGSILLNSGKTLTSLSGCNAGGMAINKDKTLLAITNGNSNIEIYQITWADGIPSLNNLYTITNTSGTIAQMAFDYADNLYVSARNANKGYALASNNREVTTPANSSLSIDLTAINQAKTNLTERFNVNQNGTILSIEGPAELSTANLYNTNGIHLLKIPFNNGKALIDTKSLPRGIYFIQANSATGKIISTKVLIH